MRRTYPGSGCKSVNAGEQNEQRRGYGAWGGGSSCYIKRVVWRPPPPQKETTLCRSWSYSRLSWVSLWGQRECSSAKSQAKALGRDGLDSFERQHRSPSLLAPNEWWGSKPVRGGRKNWETSVRTLAFVSRVVGAAWTEHVCRKGRSGLPDQRTEEGSWAKRTRDALLRVQEEVSVDVEDRLPPEQLRTRTDIKGTSHRAGENTQRERLCVGQSTGEGPTAAEAVLRPVTGRCRHSRVLLRRLESITPPNLPSRKTCRY